MSSRCLLNQCSHLFIVDDHMFSKPATMERSSNNSNQSAVGSNSNGTRRTVGIVAGKEFPWYKMLEKSLIYNDVSDVIKVLSIAKALESQKASNVVTVCFCVLKSSLTTTNFVFGRISRTVPMPVVKR